MKSLTHFHSPITKQKLSLIRPSPPQISYSSYEEINNKFKELCLQSKDEKPHHSSNYFNQESLEEHTLNRYLIKTTDKNRGKEHRRISLSTNFQRKSTQNHSIKIDSVIFKNSVGDNNTITDLVKEQIEKNQEMTSHGHINSVVKFFGNNLIASVFQALLIKSIEEVFPGPFENSNAMSSKVLNYFGISQICLKLIKTQEERNKYILKCMNSTIENLLKTWKEKVEIQERHYQLTAKEYDNLKKKNQEEIQDRFPWLSLKTKYINLQKKLKALIIQKLNDYETQISVIETLKKRDSLTKSFGKISHDELKVILNDITPPKTNSLIKMMDATHYDSALHKTQSQSGFKNSSIDTRISTTNTPNETAQGCNASINYFFQTEAKKASRVIFSKALETKEIEWDENFEEKFKKYIAEGRNLFFNEMKNAKFYEIGVMYMMKELFKEEKNNLERTAYMDAYADGAHLTNEELRFLADTSDLLNSCVDKNYIKKVVNLIDPNILHYIELNLAESIITRHKEMKYIIVKARNQYIQKNNKALKQKLNEFEIKKRKVQQNNEMIKKRIHTSNSIRCVLNKIQNNQEEFDENFAKKITSDMSSPSRIMDFEKNFEKYNKLKPYKKYTNEIQRTNYSQPKEIDLYSSPSHSNVVRHRYHPSSKIFYLNINEKKEIDAKNTNCIKNDIGKFKLQINSPQSLKAKDNFIRFYSGGPVQISDETSLFTHPQGIRLRIPTHFEIKSIIKLQSLIRGHIARKKFRIIFSQKEQNNFSLFKEKLTKMHNKTFKSQNKSNFSSPSKFNLSQINRTLSNVENNDLRELKIINKPPPKNLLLKHRKLLEATKQNNIFMARNSGFAYYPNDMNVKDKNENTPLYYSTKHSNIEFCQYLIEFGARVNERCEGGNTPFHLAFQINSIDIIMLMLDNHGDLNNANDLGQTPLAFAIPSTLKRLDLENAIATTNSSSIHNFDNNKFLKSKNPEVFKMNEFCSFNLEKMSLPSDKVRLIDSNLITHIVSFPETVINKNDIKANENIDIYMNNKKEQAIDTSSFKKKRNITLNQIKI